MSRFAGTGATAVAMDVLDPRTKGLPHSLGQENVTIETIGRQGWRVLAEDLPLPVAVLRQQALANNSRWMREFVARTGTKLAPHGKTTMSPQLFAMQMADGAWGLTLATIQQVRIARTAGIERILLANELIARSDIAYVLDELQRAPSFDFYCLVDSVDGARRLTDAATARAIGRPLNVLVEIGYQGGRAGCRDLETALAVARALKAAEPHVALRGVEGYEGLHQSLPSAEGERRVREFLQRVVSTAERFDAEGLFHTGNSSQADGSLAAEGATGGNEIILSAGGSAFYDLVAEVFGSARVRKPARVSVVLRSGCYLTHDAGVYERSFREVTERSDVARHIHGKFENALEVWAYVISVPEPGRAILGVGRRDFGHDGGMPVPIKHFRPGRDSKPADLPAGPRGAAADGARAGGAAASGVATRGEPAVGAATHGAGAGGTATGRAAPLGTGVGNAGAVIAGTAGGTAAGAGVARAAASDAGASAAIAGSSWEIAAVNDQHAHLLLPAGADVRVGDLVALGVSHPCTTFDKWQMLYVVDDDYRVCSAVETFF